MNVDRRLPDGTRHKEEVTNKSQIYVTTAGWKNSFAYEKLIETLVK
nr:MAG TPA: terminase large subunit [Caudoviricetes sp.]